LSPDLAAVFRVGTIVIQRPFPRLAASLLLSAALLAGAPARAQTEDRPGLTTFPSAFFSEVQPNNALDMVKLMPGFRLQNGNTDIRGYSGSGGNVLIDGLRPASKQEEVEEILRRIPAAAVGRIELIRSGAAGYDMQGYALLVNVVRATDVTLRGRVEAEDAFSHTGLSTPKLAGDVTWQGDGRSLSLQGAWYREADGDMGYGVRNRFLPDGTPLRLAEYAFPGQSENMQVSSEYRQTLWGGALTLNGLLNNRRWWTDITERVSFPAAQTLTGAERWRRRVGEMQGQYERSLGAADQLQVLASHRTTEIVSSKRNATPAGLDVTADRTGQRESIARFVWRHQNGPLSLETGAEGAINILNGRNSLTSNGVPVPLPAANVRVEEKRGEGFAVGTWRWNPQLTTELGLRYEMSRLSQTGDSNLTKDFGFTKPRFLTSWSPLPGHTLRFLAERQVGQLDFGDFVSSASLANNTVTAGNANLEPDRTTRLELAWERRFWERGSLTLTARRDNITALVDRVPVFDGVNVFDANGNVGNARRDELQISLILPMEKLYLEGVTVTASGMVRHSKVVDPATGQHRRISDQEPFDGLITFTHDLPQYGVRWGTSYTLREDERVFKADEYERLLDTSKLEAFVEYKPTTDWTLRLFGKSLMQNPIIRERTIYNGLRGAVPVSFLETRTLNTGAFFGFNIQRTFEM
jgi:hypothetical protein